MASNRVGRVSQLFVLWKNKYEVLHCVANKEFGKAGPEGNLGHRWEHFWAHKLCERCSPKKTLYEIHWKEWNSSGVLPGQHQPPVMVSDHFSSHHISSSTFQVIKCAYSLLFKVRISVLKEVSLSVCILWQLWEAGNMLDISSGKLRTQGSYSFRKQIVSFRFDVKYPEGCLLFPSLPSKKHREGATNLSWGSC